MRKFTLECTALNGMNKAGKLKPDDTGYYQVVLGGFDIPNPNGDVYPYKAAAHLFEESSTLMRNITSGNAYGEWGHPKRQPGQTLSNYIKRCGIVDEANIAFHIKKIEINHSDVKDDNGNTIVTILGWVKGVGKHADAFNDMLSNPEQNVCFSIRAATEDVPNTQGKLNRNLVSIVTWDFVVYPGLKVAMKYKSPALESFDKEEITEFDLLDARSEIISTGTALENGNSLDMVNEILAHKSPSRRVYDQGYLKRRGNSGKW